MRLGAMMLADFCSANSFEYSRNIQMNEGNAQKVCIQLVDLNKVACSSGSGSLYLRYMPEAGSTLEIEIQSINDDNTITRIATQDPTDPSIWCFDILPTDIIGSENIKLSLTEPSNGLKTGIMNSVIKVNRVNSGSGQSYC